MNHQKYNYQPRKTFIVSLASTNKFCLQFPKEIKIYTHHCQLLRNFCVFDSHNMISIASKCILSVRTFASQTSANTFLFLINHTILPAKLCTVDQKKHLPSSVTYIKSKSNFACIQKTEPSNRPNT